MPHRNTRIFALVVIPLILFTLFLAGTVGWALLLPAIQQQREAARREEMVRNLRQLAMALENYQDGAETSAGPDESTAVERQQLPLADRINR